VKTIRSIGIALAAGSALALGTAHAQDAKKPEAKQERSHQKHRAMQGRMKGCPEHAPRDARTPRLDPEDLS
jgi:hypothetical protein